MAKRRNDLIFIPPNRETLLTNKQNKKSFPNIKTSSIKNINFYYAHNYAQEIAGDGASHPAQ